MNSLFLFVGSLFYLADLSQVTGLASLSVDDLDLARSAILAVAKDVTSKRSRILPSKNKYKVVVKPTSKVIGGGWSRRRRVSVKTRRVRVKPLPVPKKVPTSVARNLNKFNEVMDQVERAMAQAQLARTSFQLANLRKDITNAVNRGNVRFARRALGLALYAASKSHSTSGRGKRSAADNAKKFLADIKSDLGDDKFSDFLALRGEVTLMYAVDITGSMVAEIKAAKAIVTEISKYKRSEPVDYILSSFGDPITQGSVISKGDHEVDQFIEEVGKLKATGGLDCAEYAYEGMISALYEDPRWGSPLYVFSDAPPKDATDDNKETLRVLAEDLGVTINFFVGKSCSQSPYNFESFKEEAVLHGGQFLELKEAELKHMAGFTGSALGGSTAVVSGTNKVARKKRSIPNQIAIPVDDTVSKLVVTVTTSNSPKGIRLTRPGGATWNVGRNSFTKVIVYNIDSPIKGIWKLFVPSAVGKYEYTAKVSSPENIDFEHYYTKIERGRHINVRNPLAGELAFVNLTISGVQKVQKTSLKVDIIDISGKPLVSNQNLNSVGRSGLRFTFSFQPPNKPFKLLLKGKTTSNKIFQRISRHVDDAKPLVLKEFYNSKHYTIKQGGRTSILLYLFNGSKKEQSYSIKAKNTLGYRVTFPGRHGNKGKVGAKKKTYVRVSVAYGNGNKGRVGQTLNIILIVRGKAGSITTELVPLIIV